MEIHEWEEALEYSRLILSVYQSNKFAILFNFSFGIISW